MGSGWLFVVVLWVVVVLVRCVAFRWVVVGCACSAGGCGLVVVVRRVNARWVVISWVCGRWLAFGCNCV